MDHRGFGLFIGALFEAIFALLCLPLRLAAWLMHEDDPAAEVDAAAQAYRDAAATADAAEREPVAPRESLAQAMRAYLRRERTLGDLSRWGDDARSWGLAARYEGLAEADVPRDDARLEQHVLGRHGDLGEQPLVSPGSVDDMRRALRRFAELPHPPTSPPLPTFADAEAPTYAM